MNASWRDHEVTADLNKFSTQLLHPCPFSHQYSWQLPPQKRNDVNVNKKGHESDVLLWRN